MLIVCCVIREGLMSSLALERAFSKDNCYTFETVI